MDASSPSEEIFKQRLRDAREMRELSQAELAAKAGLQPAAVSHFETGERRPSFENLRRLSAALEVSTDYLLGRVDSPEAAPEADEAFRMYQRLSDHDRTMVQGLITQMSRSQNAVEPVYARRANEPVRRQKKSRSR